jgi:hypothetical protein
LKKINKKEENLKRLEKEKDNKFPCYFKGFLRHKLNAYSISVFLAF